jgi:hypothetical protein
VWHDTVPTDAGDAMAFVKVWFFGLEEFFLLANILDQNFTPSSSKQFFLLGLNSIELTGVPACI